MDRQQHTLGGEVHFEGVGIHRGQVAAVVIEPAEPGFGRVFECCGERIEAVVDNVVNTERCTVLGDNLVTVSTVEHLLAALDGLSIDNALIRVQGVEIPILDGSALPFVEKLLQVGIVDQDAEIEFAYLSKPVFVASGESLVLAVPDSSLSYEASVDYACPEVGVQRYRYNGYDDFCTHLAPARTFGFWEEVQALLQAGLGLGGNLDNALVFGRPDHPVTSEQLRFVNEPVRHKVLDLAGDMALLGRPLQAHVFAVRGGHKLHVELVKKLKMEL